MMRAQAPAAASPVVARHVSTTSVARTGATLAARLRIAVGIAGCALALSGCYVYTPVALRPTPGMELALDLNDLGRVEMSGRLGPEIARVEGQLVEATDSTFQILMARARTLDGVVTRWSGEDVTLRREHVKEVSGRKLSRGRTALAAGSMAVAIAAFILGQALDGSSDDEPHDDNPPRPPDDQ